MTHERAGELASRLEHALVTMTNDDFSEPLSEKRDRHVMRAETMRDAIEFLSSERLGMREAFQPFADFMGASSFDKLSDDVVLTAGSPMAQRQLTVGDFRRLAAALSQPAARE